MLTHNTSDVTAANEPPRTSGEKVASARSTPWIHTRAQERPVLLANQLYCNDKAAQILGKTGDWYVPLAWV